MYKLCNRGKDISKLCASGDSTNLTQTTTK